jgi:hypothetical protein
MSLDQLFSPDRRLRASVYLGTQLAAVAFLNDNGDLLVAPAGAGAAAGAAGLAGAAGALMMVRADTYAGGCLRCSNAIVISFMWLQSHLRWYEQQVQQAHHAGTYAGFYDRPL